MLITEEQLKKIFTGCKKDKLKIYVPAFNEVWPKYSIDTPKRIAAFLGQIGVESGELRYDKELPSIYNKKDVSNKQEPTGTLYEGRKNLGNIQKGDGPKYIGRGILQITGRANYTLYANKLGMDLVENPDLACQPSVAVNIACQYFVDRNLLKFADSWDIEEITKRVNGTRMLHLIERKKYSETALAILSKKE